MAKNKGGRSNFSTPTKTSPPRLSDYDRAALHELRKYGVSDYQLRQLRKVRKEFATLEDKIQRQSEAFNTGYKSGSYSSYLSYLKSNAERYDREQIRSASSKYRAELAETYSTYRDTGYFPEVMDAAETMASDFNRLFGDYGFDIDIDSDRILHLPTGEQKVARQQLESALHYDELYQQTGEKRYYDIVISSLEAVIGFLV